MNNTAKEPHGIVERPPVMRRSFRWLTAIGFIGLGCILLATGIDVGLLRSRLESLGPWAPIAFVVISLLLMSTLLPKTVVSVTAGVMFGTGPGSCLMFVIAVLAAAFNYALGRWWLHASIDRWLRSPNRDTSGDQVTWKHAVYDLAAEAGFWMHLLIRLTPAPTMLISYCMGALGARRVPYLAAAAAAVIPQILWIHAGSTASLVHNQDSSMVRWTGGILSIVAAVVTTVIVPREAMKRLRLMSLQRD